MWEKFVRKLQLLLMPTKSCSVLHISIKLNNVCGSVCVWVRSVAVCILSQMPSSLHTHRRDRAMNLVMAKIRPKCLESRVLCTVDIKASAK